MFVDAEERRRLEAILHPRVRSAIRDAVAQLDAAYCLLVIPLLFESGQSDLVDRVLVVDIDETRQLERVAARSGLPAEQVKKIIAAQMDPAERRRRADDIIDNSASLDSLRQQVDELHKRYIGLADRDDQPNRD